MDTNKLEVLTGMKGTFNAAEGVFKVTAPRNDLPVTVDGWKMPPFMGLTTWAAFMEGKTAEAMVAGDLVLFQDEVNPVMSVLFASGVGVTAIHNHFFFDEPKVFFMHIVAIHHHMTHETPRYLFLHYWGKGSAASLATSLKKTFDVQKAVK